MVFSYITVKSTNKKSSDIMAMAEKSENNYKILLASSNLDMTELFERIREQSHGFVQLFDSKAICCKEHLLWSYLNAKTLFANKANRAKTLQMEMILCVALTSQISEAMDKVCAKNTDNFIVFCDGKSAYKAISRYLINTADFKPSEKEIKARIIGLGILSGQVADMIQEIAFRATER